MDPVAQSNPPKAEQTIPAESSIVIIGAAKQDIASPSTGVVTTSKAADSMGGGNIDSSNTASNSSKYVDLQNELQYYKTKCANLTEVVRDYETRLNDYKKLYLDNRESLVALERRLESSEIEWREKLRSVELEKDKAENEKRQARFALIDLEMKAQSSADQSSASAQSKVPAADLKALMDDIQVSKTALARSAASHMELQTQLQSIEKQHKEQLDALVTEHNQILLESASRHQADTIEYKKRIYVLEADLSNLNNMVDGLRERTRTEQQEHAVVCSNMQSAQDLLLKRNDALSEEIKKLQASYSSVSSELHLSKSQASMLTMQVDAKLDSQRIYDETLQNSLDELRLSESKVKTELAEKVKLINAHQDTIALLRAQIASGAAGSQQDSQQQIPLSRFDQAVEHAAVMRRQLEAEIELLKERINSLESEKNTLVNQKSRQETELRHAKAELNANASVVESNRLLEIEKQQLMVQLQSLRTTNTNYTEELDMLKKSYEQLLQLSAATRSSDSESVSKLEYNRVLLDLQSERGAVEQLHKKIKSYQEELMCLQRRLEDKAIADALKEDASRDALSNKQQLLYEEHISRLTLEIETLKQGEGDMQDEVAALRSTVAKQDSALHLKDQELQHIIKLTSSKPISNGPVATEAGTDGSVPQHLYKDLIQKKQVLESEKVQLLVQINDVQHKLSMMTTSKLDTINTLKQQHSAEMERLQASLNSLEQELCSAKIAEQVSTTRLDDLQKELSVVCRDAELKAADYSDAKAALQQSKTRCGSLLQDLDAKEVVIKQLRLEKDELKARTVTHDSEHRNVTKERDALEHTVRDLKREVQELRSGRERDDRVETDKYQLLQLEIDSLKAHFASHKVDRHAYGGNKENSAASGNTNFDPIRVSDAWEQEPRVRESHSQYPPPIHPSSSMTAFNADANSKQIVELGWALNQQQISMVRMEEYLLNTNKLILEMKSASTTDLHDARPTSAPASLRSSHRHGQFVGSRDAAVVDADSSPDFMSMLRDKRSAVHYLEASDSSNTPPPAVPTHKSSRLRKPSNTDRKSSEHLIKLSTRQAQVTSPFADNTRHTSSRDPQFQPANILSNEALDRLIKKYELHRMPSLHSKRGSDRSSSDFSVASANLSLMDVKSRTRRETKFMTDLRDLCQTAKKAILHDQACIRNLKDLWKSKGSSVVSAEMINSMTMKANIAVDALREGQELLKTRERKLRILSKSVEYFEQLLQQLKGVGATVNTSHVQELLRVIQQHCTDSANDFTVILRSHANQQQSSGVFADVDVDLSKEPDYLSDVAAVPDHHSSSSHVLPPNSTHTSSRQQGISDHQHPTIPHRSVTTTHNAISFTSARQSSTMSSATATALSQREATGISLIRSKEARSRILQDQIQKIAARQSQSQAECEKHFG